MKLKLLLSYLEYAALSELKTREYKVFLYILSELIENEEVRINQNLIAEELGISKSEVSKALKKLTSENILSERLTHYPKKRKYISLKKYTSLELKQINFEIVNDNTNYDNDDDL